MTEVTLGAERLTLEDVVDVARHRRGISLSSRALETMAPSAQWVSSLTQAMREGRPVDAVYSVNTGFGSLAGKQAFEDVEDTKELSRRLIISNACGTGDPLPEDTVRAAMVIRAASLTRGYSGVRPELPQLLVDMLERDVFPVIPRYGSLGASGDLIQLAHLALVMTRPAGEDREQDSGEVFRGGGRASGVQAMAEAGLERIVLGAKEGLAATNGTSFSCAHTVLALADAETVLKTAQITAAVSIEAMKGFGDAFIPQIHEARGHRGQIAVAARLCELLADSELVDGDAETDPVRNPPQDAYSLRCTPQVLGPVQEALEFVRGIVETEINAATDNPLIITELPRSLKAVSGGNFHAQYLAVASDLLAMTVSEIGNIAERRIFRLTDSSLNRGLPDYLVDSEKVGMDCGYMLPQYLAAALVSECKTLAHPDSVDSIPSSANQEDHVSMANNAGLHAVAVVRNVRDVVAIELLMACQALELRMRQEGVDRSMISSASRAVLDLVRSTPMVTGETIPFLTRDVVLKPLLDAAVELVSSGAVQAAVDAREAAATTRP
ncbi:HAL/PAL/TAL family ammonia-lyase [Kocuria marina]|uniref:HAL/PAL/TAL family ammonia-lyase n=1 Tax=Kocuria marina TaxID=223184 RepID=UPI0022E42962|nr:histidine ammonia-lyase [Kocuria marina]